MKLRTTPKPAPPPEEPKRSAVDGIRGAVIYAMQQEYKKYYYLQSFLDIEWYLLAEGVMQLLKDSAKLEELSEALGVNPCCPDLVHMIQEAEAMDASTS